mgnify:CR=1 FL=1
MTIEQTLSRISQAVESETRASRADRSGAFDVTDCELLTQSEGLSLYRGTAELALPILSDTPLEVSTASHPATEGSFVGQEEFSVVLALRASLGEFVANASVRADTSFILAALNNRLLHHGQALPGDILEGLCGLRRLPVKPDQEAYERLVRELAAAGDQALIPNESQRLAIASCCGSRLHYVWGPPGTGKTACVAQVARALNLAGERVLVLSHANAAVDACMVKIAAAFAGTAELREGLILRAGVPHSSEALSCGSILPDSHISACHPDLVGRRNHLQYLLRQVIRELGRHREKRHVSGASEGIEDLDSDLRKIRGELREVSGRIDELARGLVAEALLVGTTVSRMVVTDYLYCWRPDAVLIDEASMVNFPFVIAAAMTAAKRVVLFGDFRQLPPVVLTKDREMSPWLTRDVFDQAGIKSAIDRGESDDRVTLLETQYRMHPRIGDVVNSLAYSSRLRTADLVAERTETLARFEPFAGEQVVLADSSSMRTVCLREARSRGNSRVNPLHAALAVTAAEKALRSGCRSIGIITPYRAQARLIHSLKSLKTSIAGMEDVSVATVHRFQGSEKDLIIFDLADALPQTSASRLTGRDDELSLRLINVALSRARGKLVFIADVPFVEAFHPPRSQARKALALVRQHGITADAAGLTESKDLESMLWLSGWDECSTHLGRRLKRLASPPEADSSEGESSENERSQNSTRKDETRLDSITNLSPGFEPPPGLVEDMERFGGRLTIFAPIEVALGLERAALDVRLMSRVDGFFHLEKGRCVYLGGRDPGSPVAFIDGESFAGAFERICLDESFRVPLLDADRQREFRLVCGTCDRCGEDRRPRFERETGSLTLRCAEPGHPHRLLDIEGLQAILHCLAIRCPGCRRPAEAAAIGNRLQVTCPGKSPGCPGGAPDLESLFGDTD